MPRQLLIRLEQYENFVLSLSRPVGYFTYKGEEHQYRAFPWSIGFNPKEETTKVAVWISLPNLAPVFFARRALLSIASAVGTPISIYKDTQTCSRPSTFGVRVIPNLLDNLPKRVRLQHVENKPGKVLEVSRKFFMIIYLHILVCLSTKVMMKMYVVCSRKNIKKNNSRRIMNWMLLEKNIKKI